jgi:hypothetical protein
MKGYLPTVLGVEIIVNPGIVKSFLLQKTRSERIPLVAARSNSLANQQSMH